MSNHRKKKEKISNNKKEETSRKRHTKIKTAKRPKTSRTFLSGYFFFFKVTRRFAPCFLYCNLPNLGRLSFGELEKKTPRLNQFSLSSLLLTKQLLQPFFPHFSLFYFPSNHFSLQPNIPLGDFFFFLGIISFLIGISSGIRLSM